MSRKDWIILVVVSAVLGGLSALLPLDFMEEIVDAAWWSMVPWALLALFWMAFGIWAWRKSKKKKHRGAS